MNQVPEPEPASSDVGPSPVGSDASMASTTHGPWAPPSTPPVGPGWVPQVDHVDGSPFSWPVVLLAGLGIWLLSEVAGAIGFLAVGGFDAAENPSTSAILAGLTGRWAVTLVALIAVSRSFGTGKLLPDLGVRFRWIDLVGFPVGIVGQLFLVPIVYLPLQQIWPEAFSDEKLGERSEELLGAVHGWQLWVLIISVSIGAPIFEELFYRGFIQRGLSASWGRIIPWLFASVVFALVHFAPVEFPGLLVAGLIFGAGVMLTDRIAFGFFAHLGFNATAVVALVYLQST